VHTAAYLGHVTYKIHLFVHICVRTKLYDTGSRDYNRGSGGGAGFSRNDVSTVCQILEAACVHEASLGIAYLLSAKSLRIEHKFEQNVICLPHAVRNPSRVKREQGTDRYGVLYDIPYDCRVVQWARWERTDVGSINTSADNIPNRLVRSQTHG
jgi:hypothetical protein